MGRTRTIEKAARRARPKPATAIAAATRAAGGEVVAFPGESVTVIRDLIRSGALDDAHDQALVLLDRRIAAGDPPLAAVKLLLLHYYHIVSAQQPLAHLGTAPLRPDDRLHACFGGFLDLMHRQQRQIHELQQMIGELL